ncbi:MAG: prepilin-type N-terminal cleavage/methylation domain-containing protein, partial [Clostridia bacterium]|nr:prepilin-type N-terminal cleavage/methylation domain-containing protein [Clostridia bacterium]
MQEFDELRKQAKTDAENTVSLGALNDVRAKFIGKNGEITALLRQMKDIPFEERASFGKKVNDLKSRKRGFTLIELLIVTVV